MEVKYITDIIAYCKWFDVNARHFSPHVTWWRNFIYYSTSMRFVRLQPFPAAAAAATAATLSALLMPFFVATVVVVAVERIFR